MEDTFGRVRCTAAMCAAGAAAVLLLGGCVANTSGIEATGRALDPGNASRIGTSIVINNSRFAEDVEITDMKSAQVGDLMMTQASLRSRTSADLPIQYKFDWFDAQGFEIGSNQAWKPLLVHGNETVTIQAVAPNPLARDFRLKIRSQDDDSLKRP